MQDSKTRLQRESQVPIEIEETSESFQPRNDPFSKVTEVESSDQGENDSMNTRSRASKCIESVFPSGGFMSVLVNLCKNTLGGGILAIPIAIHNAGCVLGVAILIIVAIISIIAERFLITAVEVSKHSSYEEMARHLVGPWFNKLTIVLQVIMFWGAIVSFVVALKGILLALQKIPEFPSIFIGYWGENLIVTIFWVIFMLPFSLMRSVYHLRFTSSLGVCAVFYLTIAIIIHAAGDPRTSIKNMQIVKLSINTILSMPICIFSYGIAPISVQLYVELVPKGVARMTTIAAVAVLIVSIIYVIVGLVGTANFGDELKGNIFLNLDPADSVYIAIAFFLFCLVLTFSFAIISHIPRHAILNAFGYEHVTKAPFYIWFTIAGCVSTSALVVGLFAPGIQLIFGLLGGLTGSALFFVWPCIFVVSTPDWKISTVGYANVIGSYLVIVVGVIAGIIGTSVAIYSTIKSYQE